MNTRLFTYLQMELQQHGEIDMGHMIDRLHELMTKGDPGWEDEAIRCIVQLYGGERQFVLHHITLYANIAREVIDARIEATKKDDA